MRIDSALVAAGFRYFAAVAETGSIRAAARELNIASSAVNRQVLLLEEALGIPLFERVGRSLSLTEAGSVLLAQVNDSLRDYEAALGEVDALRGLQRGKVRVATVESVSVNLLPRMLARLAVEYPGIEVSLAVAGSDAVTSLVLSRDADIGFTFNPTSTEGLDIAYERPLPIGALVSPGHPLAGRGRVSLAECVAHPFALPSRGLSLRAALDPSLARIDPRPRPLLEANSLSVMSALAREGRCVAFQPRIGIERDLSEGQLVFLSLTDRRIPRDRFMLLRRTVKRVSPASQVFFDTALEILSDWPGI